jgi:hypothetical protein
MIMPRKETCSICGKDFMDGCMVHCPPICDECNGIPQSVDLNKINTQEDFIKAIKEANEKRYGSRFPSDIIKLMIALSTDALAAEEPLTPEESDKELRDAEVDVDKLVTKLLDKINV